MSKDEKLAQLHSELDYLNETIYEPEQRLGIGEGDRLRRTRDLVWERIVELEGDDG